MSQQIKKLYEVIISWEDGEGYSHNFRNINVLAETAEKAIAKIELKKNEFVDEVRNLGVVDLV